MILAKSGNSLCVLLTYGKFFTLLCFCFDNIRPQKIGTKFDYFTLLSKGTCSDVAFLTLNKMCTFALISNLTKVSSISVIKGNIQKNCSVCILYFFNTCTGFYTSIWLRQRLSVELVSPNMYGCFMNTKYLCTCLKTYGINLSLKQG